MSASPSLSWPQHVFLNELGTRYRAYVGGFGSGKTWVGCLDLIIAAARSPGLIQGYFGPTYPSIRDIFYPTFEEAAESLGFRVTVKTTDKEVSLYRGRSYYGTVICRSMERPDQIVGFKIARALVDEIDTLPKDKAANAWNKIIARLRMNVPGVENGAGVTTTPEGFRFVYERFAVEPRRDYSMVQASTYENARFLPDGYIESLLDSYPAGLIKAYLEGRFVNLTSGAVYRCYDREANRSAETIRKAEGGGGEALYIGMDFNVGQMAAVINVRRPDGFHAASEIVKGMDTPSVIATLRDRYQGHPVIVYPDATGQNTSSKGASLSDIALLNQAGFTVLARPSNPRVRDRVLAVNRAFERRQWWVNDKACPETARCLEQQAYDRNGEPDKSGGLDHQCDAFGYPVVYEMPVIRPVATSRELRI